MFPLMFYVQICAISIAIFTIYGMQTNIVIHYCNEPLQYHNEEIQCRNSGCYVNNNNKHKHWSHGSAEYSIYASVS